jgi:hypothetical protein
MAPSLLGCFLWASKWVLQSVLPFGVDLIWVLAFFLHLTRPSFDWFIGPPPPGLMSGDVTPCSLCTFDMFLV